MTRKWSLVLASVLLIVTQVVADGASTFVSNDHRNNLTFSINIPNDPKNPDDFLFYLSAPHENSWVAVGFGKGMKDALMLVAYTDKGGKNLTLSPRVGTGNSEPSYYKNVSIELKDTTTIRNGRYVVSGTCKKCREWNTGSIDFNSTKQPMMFAVGPDELNLNSNAKDAGLRRHDFYGKFDLDLKAASGDPGLFPPADLSEAKVTDHDEWNDHEYSSQVHAVLMLGTFVCLFPIGVYYKTIVHKVRWHYFTQGLGVLIILVGAALGLSISRSYNRSKSYTSPHQLIGLAVVALILIQATLGTLHHRIFKAKQTPTIMGLIHRFLGPVAILAALVNGFLGFNLAQSSRHNIGYAIVIVLMALILGGGGYWQVRRRRRMDVFDTPAAVNFRRGEEEGATNNDIPLQPAYGPPPAYGRPVGS